jgi:hypothetical protein
MGNLGCIAASKSWFAFITNAFHMVGCVGNVRIQHSRGEERAQLGVGLLRSLLGEVVPAVERPTAHFLGPPAPDLQDVVMLLKESLAAPQGEHRARYAPVPASRSWASWAKSTVAAAR